MEPDRFRLAVDCMGGDLGHAEVVAGVVEAARTAREDASFLLVGDQSRIEEALAKYGAVSSRISVRHASQVIEMTDKPGDSFRRKPDASVVVSASLVRSGEADAFISIGNTGAALAASLFTLRRIKGIDRPAIATPLPSARGTIVLLDAGANVDCTPNQLLEFALMGQVYARLVLGRPHPTVGLLSNGEEETKGNEVTRMAHRLFREHVPGFAGYVEGMDIFRGKSDVVVCDGFCGNIVLKTGEGVAEMVLQLVRSELTRYRWMKLFLLPLRKGMRDLRNQIDYREFGGAPLLGVNGVCIVGHGRSDARAIVNAVKVAEAAHRNGLVREIAAAASTVGEPAGVA